MAFKKLDRAFQWAGERMGAEAKTCHSDEFKQLEAEMALRYEGMDRLQKSMNAYVKWFSHRGVTFDNGQKGVPASYLGRTMIRHGEEFDHDSEFGRCLIAMGRAEERVASAHEDHAESSSSTWLCSIDRSLAMMKEYQSSRKKLEARRMNLDASTARQQKARRDDYRIDEELRAARAKFDESADDVARRMQDIKDAEQDSVRDLTAFLDAELAYHEHCVAELRRARDTWPASAASTTSSAGRSRSASASLFVERARQPSADPVEVAPVAETPPRLPIRSSFHARPPPPPRPASVSISATTKPSPLAHSSTYAPAPDTGAIQPLAALAAHGPPRPGSSVPGADSRFALTPAVRRGSDDPFATSASAGASEEHSPTLTTSSARSGSPDAWGDRASAFTTPATSTTSLQSTLATTRKAPPPPPPSRNKKPAPPVVPRKPGVLYA